MKNNNRIGQDSPLWLQDITLVPDLCGNFSLNGCHYTTVDVRYSTVFLTPSFKDPTLTVRLSRITSAYKKGMQHI